MATMGGGKPASTGLLRYAHDDTPMCDCEAEEVSRSNLVECNNITPPSFALTTEQLLSNPQEDIIIDAS